MNINIAEERKEMKQNGEPKKGLNYEYIGIIFKLKATLVMPKNMPFCSSVST